ncbi:MAG: vitamin K epoxide reductase family protein [Anaerolineales bacterium]
MKRQRALALVLFGLLHLAWSPFPMAKAGVPFLSALLNRAELVRGAGPSPLAGQVPLGIGLADFVLGIAILGMIYALISFARVPENATPICAFERYGVPILALAGLGVAGYLSYVELSGTEAFCGPVGGCNVVQASRYAKLFGVVPLGLFGASGYLLVLISAAASLSRWDVLTKPARLAVFAEALLGTAFSAYLTYLEIFVLRAACIWCLTSALLITFILAISARPAASSLVTEAGT